MADRVRIASDSGLLELRPEQDADRDFRFDLFCNSRPPEWRMVALPPDLLARIMQQQFQAQTLSYRAQFPAARFDIVELDGVPVGRIVVDRAGGCVDLVDLAIVPALRGRGLGTAILRHLTDGAARQDVPVRLKVASSNDPSMRLYLRLGFVVTETAPMYLSMAWHGTEAQPAGRSAS